MFVTELIWRNWTTFGGNLALFPKEVFPDVGPVLPYCLSGSARYGNSSALVGQHGMCGSRLKPWWTDRVLYRICPDLLTGTRYRPLDARIPLSGIIYIRRFQVWFISRLINVLPKPKQRCRISDLDLDSKLMHPELNFEFK